MDGILKYKKGENLPLLRAHCLIYFWFGVILSLFLKPGSVIVRSIFEFISGSVIVLSR